MRCFFCTLYQCMRYITASHYGYNINFIRFTIYSMWSISVLMQSKRKKTTNHTHKYPSCTRTTFFPRKLSNAISQYIIFFASPKLRIFFVFIFIFIRLVFDNSQHRFYVACTLCQQQDFQRQWYVPIFMTINKIIWLLTILDHFLCLSFLNSSLSLSIFLWLRLLYVTKTWMLLFARKIITLFFHSFWFTSSLL